MTPRHRAAAALLATTLVTAAAPALAYDSIDDLPTPTDQQLAASVWQWSLEGSVRSFAQEDPEESSWTLATDVLFRIDSWELPESTRRT